MSFAKEVSDNKAVKRIENTEVKSKRRSMERLKKLVRSIPVDDEKKIMEEYRERKYGG